MSVWALRVGKKSHPINKWRQLLLERKATIGPFSIAKDASYNAY
jgi:hypothetical protein